MDLLYHSDGDAMDEGYSDFLKEVFQMGRFGSLRYSCKTYVPDEYKNNVKRSTQAVWKSVLDADRVQWIVTNIAREACTDKQVIMKEAAQILKEMAYKDHLNLVRFFGFTMYHVMKSIYRDGVYYNNDTLQSIRNAMREHPVIIMPSHRSYMDFLIISILAVHLDLPLPAIASGMDFMTMGAITYLLRSSGAFFMRRSFGSDRLYWALFTEYVHTILINGDRPIEFFIEGTRSRSGKSLNPKLGLFSVVAEPYLKAQIYDVMIVPTSISYDRILEESLYAYELLGIPKPKESTSGVFKATSIMSENYGSLHVHFAEPISLRNECSHMDRAVHACYPRYMLRLTKEEQSHLIDISYKVLQIQQNNMMISTWSVIATVLCQYRGGIKFAELVENVQWLYDILRKCKVKTKIPSGNMADVIKHTLLQHMHLVTVVSKDALDARVQINQIEKRIVPSVQEKLRSMPATLRDNAAIHVMLASYRNQLVHIFVRPAFVAYALQHKNDLLACRTEGAELHCSDVIQDFSFLRKLFCKEFIFAPQQSEADYMNGIDFLCRAGTLHMKGEVLHFNTRGAKMIAFLMNLLRPFLLGYTLTCQYLSKNHQGCEVKELCNSIQLWIAEKIHEENMMKETLSKDLLTNSIYGLAEVGALNIHKVGDKNSVHVRRAITHATSRKLSALMLGTSEETIDTLRSDCLVPKL